MPGDRKSPRGKKSKDLPPLNGELPSNAGASNKYLKSKNKADEVPDLDDMMETPDSDSMMNGGSDELVYGL